MEGCSNQPRNTEECWEPSEVEEAQKEFIPKPLEGEQPCQPLDFKFLASRAVRKCISVVFSHPVCGSSGKLICYSNPGKLILQITIIIIAEDEKTQAKQVK